MKSILFFILIPFVWFTSGSKNSKPIENNCIALLLSGNPQPFIGGDTIIHLSAEEEYVNVMGNRKPSLPSFTALTKKPGKVRGYVKNLYGQPLAGAFIGLRSSAVGGYYSSATGSTDAKGYYEIELPRGACHFWAAAYALEYGGGEATVNLHPSDGETGSFASIDGEVEHFVLLPYGIANKEKAFNRPGDPFSYHGGSIRVENDIYQDSWSRPGSLPLNSNIEIKLTPEGETIDGGSRPIINKKVGGTNFMINNIPVGKYKITVRLKSGGDLTLKNTDYRPHPVYGLRPKEAIGSASILFIPYSASPKSSIADRGSWSSVSIKVAKPT